MTERCKTTRTEHGFELYVGETYLGTFGDEVTGLANAIDVALQRVHDAGLRRGVEDAAEVCERLADKRRSEATFGWADAVGLGMARCARSIRALLDPKPDPDQGPGDPLVSELLREHSSGEMRPLERGSRDLLEETILSSEDPVAMRRIAEEEARIIDEEMRRSRGSARGNDSAPAYPGGWEPSWGGNYITGRLGDLSMHISRYSGRVTLYEPDGHGVQGCVGEAVVPWRGVSDEEMFRSAADWAVSRGPSTSTPPQPAEIVEADAGRAPEAPRPGPCRMCGDADCYMHMNWTDAEIDRELTIRAAYAALRPHDHDRPTDRVDDVWKRPLGEDEWEEDGLHIMTVCNVGPDSLLMEDGEWWDDHMLLDEGFVRQKREGDAEGSES